MDELKTTMIDFYKDELGSLYGELEKYNPKYYDVVYNFIGRDYEEVPDDRIRIFVPNIEHLRKVLSLVERHGHCIFDVVLSNQNKSLIIHHQTISLVFGADPKEYNEGLIYLQQGELGSDCMDQWELEICVEELLKTRITPKIKLTKLACITNSKNKFYFGWDDEGKLSLYYNLQLVHTGNLSISKSNIVPWNPTYEMSKRRYGAYKHRNVNIYIVRVIEDEDGNPVNPSYASEDTIEFKLQLNGPFKHGADYTVLSKRPNTKSR